MARDVIDQAIEAIADDGPIDWQALDSGARSEAEREELKCLRVLRDVADLHRSATRSSTDTADAGPETTRPGSSVTPTDHLDRHWGRYELVEQIGEGSYGRVYRAWDPELEREVAIKILHRHVADAALKERLLREGRALAKVTHENVVRVLGVESHGERVGLCMEFVSGVTLEAVLRSHGMLNAREATLVGEDVCRALAAVHRAGFVHRDVKARNVMREQAGRTVLMDFGTGYRLEAGSGTRVEVVGTPMYMAPEILAGQAPSIRSDIYSVGVLLYYLVTASYPVEGAAVMDLVEAHIMGRRRALSERRPDLPMPFIAVVSRALAADPLERWPSAGALLEALEEAGRPQLQHRARTVLKWVVGLAAVLLGMTGLGILSSRSFNATLGRADFVHETISDWLYWGAVSSVGPTVLAIFAVIAVSLFLVLVRLVRGAFPRTQAIETALGTALARLHLGDLTTLSSCALLIAVSALIGTCWYFSSLIGALVGVLPDISTAPLDRLALLTPAFKADHLAYRAAFSWVTILSVAVWYPVVKLAARRGEALNKPLLAGGAAVIVLSLAFLHSPYRLFYYSDLDTVNWRGAHCYILGERSDDYLVFCPELQTPRSRTVKKSAPDLERVGTKENIFGHVSITKVASP